MHGIYIHVPFCARKCAYCDFYSVVPQGHRSADGFMRTLAREMELFAERWPEAATAGADTVYFGGGTPSLLGARRLVGILSAVRKRFVLSPGAEITAEANPGTTSFRELLALRRGGFNRLSIGVQSFDPAVLSVLGRIHGAPEVSAAYRDARAAGFDSVGVDLIFGIPGQARRDWEADLRRAIDLSPDHLSAYALAPERGTPLFEAIRRGEAKMPADDEVAAMYQAARRLLGQAGYVQYEISNFCRPGFSCRHNMKYWRRQGYLGFGPSAHGLFFPAAAPLGLRTAAPPSLPDYEGRIASGRLPWTVKRCDARDAWKESLIAGLRLVEGVDVDDVSKRLGPPPDDVWHAVESALRQGRLIREGTRVRVPAKFFFVSNEVLAPLA